MAVITGRYGAVEFQTPVQDVNELEGEGIVDRFGEVWGTDSPDSSSKLTDSFQFNANSASFNNGQGPKIVSSMTSWSLDNTITPIEYAASNTHGYKGKLKGLHDASGNISGLGAIPPLAPGQRFRFYGFTGPKDGIVGSTNGIVYAITAIVNSVQIQVSYQWNSSITWSVGWQADWHQNGDELIKFDSAGFWDYSDIPCCELMPSTKKTLEIAGAQDMCLLDANIQFTNETAQYANSCSAGAGGWQSRLPGPTTCTVSTNIQGDDFKKTGDLNPGTNHNVKIYVGSDSCPTLSLWEFDKLFFTGFSGLNVDVTNNSPLQFSCNMDFNAYPDCEPGYIRFAQGISPSEATPVGTDSRWQYLIDLTGKYSQTANTSQSTESNGG